MMKKAILAAACCWLWHPAHAVTGAELLRAHESADAKIRQQAIAYISGFIDGLQHATWSVGLPAKSLQAADELRKRAWLPCFPENLTTAQAADLVFKHLKDNPSTRDQDVTILATGAFLRAWPCR